MRTKKPNFRVKHPYQNLINSICLGLILLLSSILSVFLVKPLSTDYGFVDAYGGNGSEERPYLIYNLDDLENVKVYSKRTMVAGFSNSRRNFKLMADIDASKLYNIVDDQFNGTFNGNGKTITSSMQLFNTIEKGSTIKGLNIVVKNDDSLFDPFSDLSLNVYKNNVLYNDLISERGGHIVKLNYGFDEPSKNAAIYAAVYYAESIYADYKDTQSLYSEADNLLSKNALSSKMDAQTRYIDSIKAALDYYKIDDFEQYTSDYLDPIEYDKDGQLISSSYEAAVRGVENIGENTSVSNPVAADYGYENVVYLDEDFDVDEAIAEQEKEREERLSSKVDHFGNSRSVAFTANTARKEALLANLDVLFANGESNDNVMSTTEYLNIPALVVFNYGTIENINVTSYSSINKTDETYYGRGGVVRFNEKDALIKSVDNSGGDYYAASNSSIGGIADYNAGTIDMCSTDVNLTGGVGFAHHDYVRYMVAWDQTYTTGGYSGGNCGGITGTGSGTITNCYTMGNVTGGVGGAGRPGGKGGIAGGLAGNNSGYTISTSYHMNGAIRGGGGGYGYCNTSHYGPGGGGGRNGRTGVGTNYSEHRGGPGGGGYYSYGGYGGGAGGEAGGIAGVSSGTNTGTTYVFNTGTIYSGGGGGGAGGYGGGSGGGGGSATRWNQGPGKSYTYAYGGSTGYSDARQGYSGNTGGSGGSGGYGASTQWSAGWNNRNYDRAVDGGGTGG
ncbi:MAG: hypothetical protein IKB42_01265, partial [Clostridia bacterium]|nr:hypothetical protein [Clostridia bacterium]